jgi:hypothetical protein
MPEPFYFISYSPVDGEDIALKLGDQLVAGPPSIPVWLAARNLQGASIGMSRSSRRWAAAVVSST